MSKEEGMEEKSAKQSSEEEEEEDSKTPQLFPLFPFQQPHAPLQIETSTTTTTTTITTTNSDNPQWLSNTSFTTDLSVVHHSVSSLYKDLPTITNQPEEENEVPDKAPSQQPSYTILDSPKSSSSSDETEKSRRKKKRRKTKHWSKSRDSPLDPNKYYSTSRKAGVSAWAGSDTKPSSKDYYFDSCGDRDNLAFGSLYRMDVARYKSLNYTTKSHFSNQWKNWDSVLDGDRDIDALDGKLRSGGRYWSSKYSVLERHKSFKRLRIVASPFISESSEFVPFSDVDDESQVEKSVLEESWEEEVLRRTREFNKMARESPHDENVWLAFSEFQDKIASRQPQKGARLQTLEKKISILEKATELNPDNEELLLHLMKAYQKRDSTDVLTERWEKVLVQHSGSYKMWSEFLRVIQCDFSKFKVSEMRKMYAHAIQALSAARGRLYRQMEIHQTIKSSSSEAAVIQLELGLVDIFSSLCRLEWQSGYQELATALFQAELEYSLFCPSLLLTEQNKQRLFEHFWKGTNARLGEDGALGWSMWLEKEEENRQKVINEVSLQENEEGGWTGWSELPSKNDEATRTPKPLIDDVVVVNEDEEDSETEDIQEDDIESLLKKLGVDVDAEADHEVKDTATWGRWSEEELSRDSQQWMPLHEKSDKEVDDHLLRVILFEDITEHLFSLLSEEARLALVFQFIDFFGGRISKWVCTNSPSWKAKTLSLETLSDFILDDLRKIHETTNQVQSSSSNFSLNDLLGSPSDIPKGMGMMKFLRNAVLLCLSVFPRNHILEEAALVAEELFMTKMNSSTCSVTPSRALAKGLLKNDRQDLLLCGIYARHEAAFGNIDLARKVFDMALSSIDGLPLDHRSNAPLLYHWYAEMELSNCLAGGLGSCAMRAMHILSCLGTGMKYSTFNSQPSSVQLLRARQGFKEQIGTLRGAWVRGDIKDESVALICSAALFEELTTGWASAIAVLEEAFSMVLPERRRQSLQLESLFNYYIQILQKHCSRSRPSRVWASILQGLQIYPCSPKLFAAFVETGCIYTVPNKLRWIFDEYCQKKPSVIVWLFALSYEFSKAASLHRIHALFEKALTNDKLHDSVILWRCYIAYEIEIACNPSAARRIFYRAINACPWSKKLWLDGFLKLNSIFTAKELSDLQEVMRDKELNLRTDIYEILLQDEIKS